MAKAKKLFVVVGPTAVGKTAVAIALAKYFRAEVVSADARQLFKELTIGTAKPTSAEMEGVVHHFIGTHSIANGMSAGQFGVEALEKINLLFQVHKEVILCGGSGLYIKAILEGFDEMPEIPMELREEISYQYKEKGLIWLQQAVEKYDPDFELVSDKKNPQRLMRALELLQASEGKIVREKHKRDPHPFQVVKIGLNLPRAELYRRIDDRVDKMMEKGLLEEATSLYDFKDFNALQTVGYQEIFDFIDGKYDQEEAVRLIKRNSRRYAKRQLTWFRRDSDICWFDPTDWTGILNYAASGK